MICHGWQDSEEDGYGDFKSVRKSVIDSIVVYCFNHRCRSETTSTYGGNRKKDIGIWNCTLEALEEAKEDPLEDDLLETIASAISKLQMIEDKYYYSLDLNRYLNNLEDDAYEE